MIAVANKVALEYANAIEPQIHIESEDLADAAIFAALRGRPLKYAIIDEIRSIGGRLGKTRVMNPFTRSALYQIAEGYDKEGPDPEYIIRLALKRCGVLMLDCLPERQRKIIMLRYWHELEQAEIAEMFGVSPCRISQIERQACKRIAAELERRGIKSMRDVI